jgi:Gram-negative bacterial TonB protein C-terminal
MRKRIAFLAGLFALAGPCAMAQTSEPGPVTPPPSQTSTASESALESKALDDLKQQIEDFFAALKKKPYDRFDAAIKELRLPDEKAWFSEIFGPENAEKMAQIYVDLWPRFEDINARSFKIDHDMKRTDILVRRASTADFMDISRISAAMQLPAAMYIVSSSKHGTENDLHPGFYVFVQGQFRCIPLSVFRVLPGVRKSRVRIAGNVSQAKVVKRVQPVCPGDARVRGDVVLRAIIALDGSVGELNYVSGPPLLTSSAIQAVKDWRFETTYLNGEPIEVDTTISVSMDCSH